MLQLYNQAKGTETCISMHSISVASGLLTKREIPIRRFFQTLKQIYLCHVDIHNSHA